MRHPQLPTYPHCKIDQLSQSGKAWDVTVAYPTLHPKIMGYDRLHVGARHKCRNRCGSLTDSLEL